MLVPLFIKKYANSLTNKAVPEKTTLNSNCVSNCTNFLQVSALTSLCTKDEKFLQPLHLFAQNSILT